MPARSKTTDTVFVALLRGVNVGGNNMISMSALKSSFEKLGFADVATYINSGNIIFRTKGNARKLEQVIEAMLSREYRLDSKVVIRSFAEMANVVAGLPKSWTDDRNWRYNVMFLRHTIDGEQLLDVLQPKPDIEQVVYRPGVLFWSARVDAITRTAMNKVAGQRIFKDITVRNVNTTRKLYERMQKMVEE